MFGFKTKEPPEETSLRESGFFDCLDYCAEIFSIKAKQGPNRATRRHCEQISKLFKDDLFRIQSWNVWKKRLVGK